MLFSHMMQSQSSLIDKRRYDVLTTTDTLQKIEHVLAFLSHKNSLSGDTIYHYANECKRLAQSRQLRDPAAWADYYLYNSQVLRGNNDSLLHQIKNQKNFNWLTPRHELYYKVHLLEANLLNRASRHTEAQELQFDLLQKAETNQMISAKLFTLNYIGASYLEVNQLEEGRTYLMKGIELIASDSMVYPEERCYLIYNMALSYFKEFYLSKSKQKLDTLLHYLEVIESSSRKNEYLGILHTILFLKGNTMGLVGKIEEAKRFFKEGSLIENKINDPYYKINDVVNLSSFYYTHEEYENAIQTVNEGLSLIDQSDYTTGRLALLNILAGAYKKLNRPKEYSAALEQLIEEINKLNQLNDAKKIAEVRSLYELEKKEKELAQNKLKLYKKNILLVVICSVFLIISVYVLRRIVKTRSRHKMQIQKLIFDQTKKQKELLQEAEEVQKKRIAAELHDNLGVQANAILHHSNQLSGSTVSDQAEIIDELNATAKEMLINLRETVWALKRQDVISRDFWLRMINFTKQMSQNYKGIEFKIEGEIPEDFIFSSSRALHLILFLQEGVQNAVRHARAKHIKITSYHTTEYWFISISDDGIGFDPHLVSTKPDAYGLTNMKQRAQDGSFMYEINSLENIGTSIKISILLIPDTPNGVL